VIQESIMAKMFYTLDEAAQRLGVDAEKIKEMAASGELQQFRDRDKLMFKRDQIDTLAGGSGAGDSDSGSPIPLVPSDDTDAISLADTNMASKPGLTSTGTSAGTGTGSGMSVFGPDEVEPVDPLAQTAVTNPMADTAQEELSLESVGSGSGLLDLTRESDDTSLGAELLDEIYPGGTNAGEGSLASGIGSSGVFESAISMETGTGGTAAGGLTDLQGAAPAMPGAAGGVGGVAIATYDAGIDTAGSNLGTGLLIGTTVSLVIALIVAVSAISGVQSAITGWTTSSVTNYGILCGGLLVGSLVLGFGLMMIGKAGSR
jgi:excisionase family DNA binding protein